jgi:hypothetical protein
MIIENALEKLLATDQNLVVDGQGHVVLPVIEDYNGRASFMNAFRTATTTGTSEEFNKCATSENVAQIALRTDPGMSLENFEGLVGVMLDLHSFPEQKPVAPEPEPVEDDRPRDPKTGQYLSEFDIFCASHSMSEIRQKAARDKTFGDEFRRRYFEQTVQRGEYDVLGAPQRNATIADRQELEAFADAFRTTPTSAMKPIAGFVTMAGKKYPYEIFRETVEKCAEIGLL